MLKYIIFIGSLLLSTSVWAISGTDLDNAGFSKLSNTQKAAILQNIASQVEEAAKPQIEVPSTEIVEKFANVGPSVAKAIKETAQELGVVVNEFLYTPVGMMTAGLIVYKVVGDDVLTQLHGFFQSTLFTIVWVGYLIWYIRRNQTVTITYSTTRMNIFRNPVIEKIEKSGLSDERSWAITICSFICLAISIILL